METSVKIGSNAVSKATAIDHRICVAPMMDYTDRHFRFLLRLLNPAALLYTEMINAQAILRGDDARLLSFDRSEHPVALQLGGSDAKLLADAARIGQEYGYDEINLNCGCPSDRVQAGRFGACLMQEPQRVAECVAAMRSMVHVPVTVKCRIGIEPADLSDDYAFLSRFIDAVSSVGCTVFIVHARKAVLVGLSPKENREIPPLRYDIVERLRRDFPHLKLIVNGGIRRLDQVQTFLHTFDGVMLGREICENPYRLAELHSSLVDPAYPMPDRSAVIVKYLGYVREQHRAGERLAAMLRPVLALYAGQPRGRSWRRFISERGYRADATPDVLLQALRIVAVPGQEEVGALAM
jgi:tRNA-dihydrouridine synthase A